MPAAINISDEDISYSERILLCAGESFDDERRKFIKNLDTIDLQAVPGSGKTTAILAKLLILDRYLPFSDGSGILVISHTNAAIDEIREKIGDRCTNLFRYPNFVGTIQSFVDEFLAVPYYTNKYKKSPVRIDDDNYIQKFSNPPFILPGLKFSSQESKNALYFLRLNTRKDIRWSHVNGKSCLTEGYGGKEVDFKKPQGNTKSENYKDWSEEEKARVREWITGFKEKILADGYLCFDDAYYLAVRYLSENPQIKSLLQRRFGYVFVDEMQDMESRQHDLLEALFFDAGTSISKYQRIGDKNQSIFSEEKTGAESFWSDRVDVLELNGSYRLNPVISSVVERFAVNPIRIEGRKKNADGTDVMIKPHFLVFSDNTKESVIPRFAELITTLVAEKKIPQSPRNKYKAVAWATKRDEGKLRLCDYHPGYSREEQRQRADYPSLASYVTNYNKEDRTFSSIEKNINNALLRILRDENVSDVSGTPYSKKKLAEFLREAKPDYFEIYKAKLYAWCFDVLRGKGDAALQDVKAHVPVLLAQFGRAVRNSAEFINGANGAPPVYVNGAAKNSSNIFQRDGGIEIEVSTVHRVKGETHTATLYMETFYERGGGGNHESERLKNPLKGIQVDTTRHKLIRQSAQMVYVGFSRPTHLLCFAVHENRFNKLEADIDKNIWEIVRL